MRVQAMRANHTKGGNMMSLRRRGVAVALLVISVAVVVPLAYGNHGEQNESGPAGLIGAGFVRVNENHLLNPALVRAFVPTGSKSHRCLVTYSESTGGTAGSTLYCGARTVDGVDGLLITISLREELDDLFLSMTVFQQFAKGYGAPVLYEGN